jgi:hypothetical protein
MADIAAFLNARWAEEAERLEFILSCRSDNEDFDGGWDLWGDYGRAVNAAFDPRQMLDDIAAKRAILAEVLSWEHAYIDGDTWLSCAQAVSAFAEDGTPGSGCADEDRAGGPCDCGLDRRRATMLHALAAPYAGRPGFKDDWRL